MLLRGLLATAVIGLLAAGCAGPPGHTTVPFGGAQPPPKGDFTKGPVVIGRIYDIEGVLRNFSPDPVRLTSLQLVSPSGPGIRVLNVRAYPISQVGTVSAVNEGDLPKNCSELYKPHPVTEVAIAPRSSANWVIAIALVFLRPGRYDFGRVRIGYVIAGKAGSQLAYISSLHLTAIPQHVAPRDLYNLLHCSKYIAPSVATYSVHNVGQAGWSGGTFGLLYANGNVSRDVTVSFRMPGGRHFVEKVAGGTWRRSGNTVALCLRLAGASRHAPSTDRICASGIPITGTSIRVKAVGGWTTLLRVHWIPWSS